MFKAIRKFFGLPVKTTARTVNTSNKRYVSKDTEVRKKISNKDLTNRLKEKYEPWYPSEPIDLVADGVDLTTYAILSESVNETHHSYESPIVVEDSYVAPESSSSCESSYDNSSSCDSSSSYDSGASDCGSCDCGSSE